MKPKNKKDIDEHKGCPNRNHCSKDKQLCPYLKINS